MNKSTLIELYEKGLNDSQIAKEMGYKSAESIRQWRKKLNLESTFSYESFRKINKEQLISLIEQGYKDSEISEILNIKTFSIYTARKRWKIDRKPYNRAQTIIPTQRQLEILTGCLLGDGCLNLSNKSLNPRFSCEHGIKQKEYCYWKFKELESLDVKYKESKRNIPDPRNGLYYESSTIRSTANTEFLPIYHTLYKDKTKVITEEFLKNYTDLSLAVHYMDDGTKADSYYLATNCFSQEDLEIFKQHLENNFGLSFNYCKNGSIYIPAKHRSLFTYHIKKHIHPSMMYKLVS